MSQLRICIAFISFLTLGAVHAQGWKFVSASRGFHSLGIKSDNSLWAWGLNNYGQLGDSSNIQKVNPVRIGHDNDWRIVSAGRAFSMAIKTDSSLWAWGYNADGQLASGNYVHRNFPAKVDTNRWIDVVTGVDHAIAMRSDSTIWGWGWGGYGAVGNGTNIPYGINNPALIGNDSNWRSISTGAYCSFGIKSNGTLWAWGLNPSGQLGFGNINGANIPTIVGTDTDWKKVVSGGNMTLGLKSNGTIWGWGDNTSGAVGVGSVSAYYILSPVQIGFNSQWVDITCGSEHSMARDMNGINWMWGKNTDGEAGITTGTMVLSPQIPDFVPPCFFISAGHRYSMAITNDSCLIVGGYNNYGVLGDSSKTNRLFPTLAHSEPCQPFIVLNLEKKEQVIDFDFYPVPAKEKVFIKSPKGFEVEYLEILDLTGKVILLTTYVNEIDVSALEPGMYLIKINSGDVLWTSRMIVVK